jgi:hypothetical protein
MAHIEEVLIFEVTILGHSKMQGIHLQIDYETQRETLSICLNESLQEL